MVTPWFTASFLSLALFVAVFLSSFGALFWVLRKVARVSPRSLVTIAIALAGFASLILILAVGEVFLSFSLPPRPLVAAWVGFAVLLFLTRRSAVGEALESLPLGYWVLLQAFRLPLELVMHRLSREGVMPSVMSYSGRNFDILTGVLAVVVGVGLLRFRFRKWTAWVFGVSGTLLLMNVLLVAVRTMPGVSMRLESELPNVWVCYPPFVLLPAMLVPLAAWLHYRLFVALLADVFPNEIET